MLKFTTQEDERSGARVVALQGVLTIRTIFDFQHEVRKPNGGNLILDLSGVDYMDSAGLGAILGARASCERQGKRLALVGASPRVLTLFELTHTDTVLPRFASVDEAVRSLQ